MNQAATPHVLFGPQQESLLREEILADLLEASATRSPDQIALIFGERQLSYRELNAQADLVAARLIAAGPSLAWANSSRRSSFTSVALIEPASSEPPSRVGPVPDRTIVSI